MGKNPDALNRRRGHALNLEITDDEDLSVAAALLQDAVVSGPDMEWHRERRRFVVLANRFRWEAGNFGTQTTGEPERVRSLLVINSALAISLRGISQPEAGDILCVLSLTFEPTESPGGYLRIHLAGGAMIRLEIECLDMILKDVTQPYAAPSGSVPFHDSS